MTSYINTLTHIYITADFNTLTHIYMTAHFPGLVQDFNKNNTDFDNNIYINSTRILLK
jgi:hypothetical protein